MGGKSARPETRKTGRPVAGEKNPADHPWHASPGALYAAGGLSLLSGAGVAVLSGVVLTRVSRHVLGFGAGLTPTAGLAAFIVLLLCALALGILSGGLLAALSSPKHPTGETVRNRRRAPQHLNHRSALAPARLSAALCAGLSATGSALACVIGVAAGAVQAAPATWISAAVHTTLVAAIGACGAYLGTARLFGGNGASVGTRREQA